jgi:hypothetical protein
MPYILQLSMRGILYTPRAAVIYCKNIHPIQNSPVTDEAEEGGFLMSNATP